MFAKLVGTETRDGHTAEIYANGIINIDGKKYALFDDIEEVWALYFSYLHSSCSVDDVLEIKSCWCDIDALAFLREYQELADIAKRKDRLYELLDNFDHRTYDLPCRTPFNQLIGPFYVEATTRSRGPVGARDYDDFYDAWEAYESALADGDNDFVTLTDGNGTEYDAERDV